ncbi:SGNH hydrolase [Naegleria gruberi]|uniref:SGNH hydrolase n=1 Tax=Naegleria gruberi TaxID=5762 RepID=D2VIH1_NAEGR|nr:SGNH hydrolase [Naegleria gruberi]EFC43356.1 SGNH hydrolase [Naegleria gruberi]|eukprot:XP_002676100.1 SGNH hydrolase [Naegleria gruberi]
MALGASITAGFYCNGLKFHPYSTRLSKLLSNLKNIPYHVEPFGLSGERTDRMKIRLDQIFNYYPPESFDGVIIIAGTNDLISCESDDTIGNLIEMYERCLQYNHFRFVVACSIPSSAFDVKSEYLNKKSKINNALREFVEKSKNPKLLFIDLMEELNFCKCTEEEQSKYWDDPIHFTPDGYDRIADILFEKLQQNPHLL